jgi:hypothetical protein
MVDFTSIQAQAKQRSPPASREGGKAKATAAKPLSSSPPLSADGVERCTTNSQRSTPSLPHN